MNVSPVSALITPMDRRGHRKQSLPPPSSHSEARPWWEPEEEPSRAAKRSACGLDKIRPEMSVNCLFPRVSVNMRVKYLVLLIKRITSLNTSSRGPGRLHRHVLMLRREETVVHLMFVMLTWIS